MNVVQNQRSKRESNSGRTHLRCSSDLLLQFSMSCCCSVPEESPAPIILKQEELLHVRGERSGTSLKGKQYYNTRKGRNLGREAHTTQLP
ncbi:hypothetical protein LEMLEM_LOCUS7958 [Lemmus lemmus]